MRLIRNYFFICILLIHNSCSNADSKKPAQNKTNNDKIHSYITQKYDKGFRAEKDGLSWERDAGESARELLDFRARLTVSLLRKCLRAVGYPNSGLILSEEQDLTGNASGVIVTMSS